MQRRVYSLPHSKFQSPVSIDTKLQYGTRRPATVANKGPTVRCVVYIHSFPTTSQTQERP